MVVVGQGGGTRPVIGLLGGTLDPPTAGHVAVAAGAREALGLDAVWLVPLRPWTKDPTTTDHDRLAMCALAAMAAPGIEVYSVDLERVGPTYTLDTLAALTARHPGVDWTFLIGSDIDLATWRVGAPCLDLARFVRVTRPGVCVVRQAGRWEDDVALVDLGLDSAGVAGLSSTEVRARVGSGASIEHMVDPAVAAYIERGGLYRDLACHSLRHSKLSASYSF